MSYNLSNFSLDYFSLNGKTALVTGGNTGIGQACAVALAKAGADIFIPTHSRAGGETQELVEKEGRAIKFAQGDLSDRNFREKLIPECIQQMGRIDILVNNAGTIRRSPLLESKYEDWEAVMELNLNAAYQLSFEAAKAMTNQGGGKIVNICSLLSFQGGKFVPSYTASKHGLAGVTKSFANELASKNIQVNAIAPGYIETSNTLALREDKNRRAEISSRIPAERWGTPEDLMGAVVFLSSKASDYMNGHILAVDGGWMVR